MDREPLPDAHRYGADSGVRGVIAAGCQGRSGRVASTLPLGTALREPRSKALGDGLFELRGRAEGVRIFYMFRPERRVLVLDGYLKKRQNIPPAIIARIRAFKRDAEQRGA